MQMTTKPTSSDIFDINRKTGALILGKNRLDDYATKYLTKHCKEALETPMPLPVNKILQEAGLTVQEVSLSRNLDIFGCCLLLDAEVEVYDHQTGFSNIVAYPGGTILIDPDSEAMYGEGAKRNTLIHEALHWEKDKTYFEILAIKNAAVAEKLYPIMCRQSETFFEPSEGKKTKENEVKWLEWQAHRLAPRVLMPYDSFKKKALEFIEKYQSQNNDLIPSCDTLIEDLSEFFIVSRASVKYRLIEVGLLGRISNFNDYDAVFAEINSSKEFISLTPVEAYQLISEDSLLREWVRGGRFVYADGYFVLADPKYITVKDGAFYLTAKAKKNLAQCAINIHEQKYSTYRNIQKDFMGFAVLYKVEGIDQRILTFHPKYQANFKYEPDEAYSAFHKQLTTYDQKEEIELVKKLADPTSTLCQCLWYLMENRKWTYPETFNGKTHLHKNYHGKIKNDKYNNMGTDVLMAICIGLKLSLRITEKLFDKSNNKLNYYEDPDRTYIRIMENMPGISLQDFNSICENADVKQLGSTIKDEEN